ncbi:amidase family protein, partial [Roseomonas sp. 18066]|uniref:amidase family protein n=1 Tax=Roseomonas sp. 18066 TaxID=2681412 RepID=UPI002104B1A9
MAEVSPTAIALVDGFRKGRLSPVDVLEQTLERLDAAAELNAVALLDAATGRLMAEASAQRWREGRPMGPLDGVPVAIKDTGHVIGWPTRYGSATTASRPLAAEDSPGIARLREAGAVFFCKTTTPEYGWKGITHGPLTGVTRNPHDTALTPGGSSGGSAALVAAGVVPIATGGDGGGSIRIPAGFCGVVGLKPSYGLVPHAPAPLGWLGVFGGMTRDVADTSLLMTLIAAPDGRDAFAVPAPAVDYAAEAEKGVAGLRIAISRDLGFRGVVDPAVADAFEAGVQALGRVDHP